MLTEEEQKQSNRYQKALIREIKKVTNFPCLCLECLLLSLSEKGEDLSFHTKNLEVRDSKGKVLFNWAMKRDEDTFLISEFEYLPLETQKKVVGLFKKKKTL